jgi:hypothetical protein
MKVYAINYDFYLPAGGSFKYAANPSKENRTEFYTVEESQSFLANYKRYKKDDLVFDNVKAFFADIPELSEETMEKVINAI